MQNDDPQFTKGDIFKVSQYFAVMQEDKNDDDDGERQESLLTNIDLTQQRFQYHDNQQQQSDKTRTSEESLPLNDLSSRAEEIPSSEPNHSLDQANPHQSQQHDASNEIANQTDQQSQIEGGANAEANEFERLYKQEEEQNAPLRRENLPRNRHAANGAPVPQLQQQQQQQQVQQQQPAIHMPGRRATPWCKLLVIGCLAGLGLVMQATLYTLKWMQSDRAQTEQHKIQKQLKSKQQTAQGSTIDARRSKSKIVTGLSSKPSMTELVSGPLNVQDLHLHRQQASYTSMTHNELYTKREALWKQAVSTILADWDPNVQDSLFLLDTSSSSASSQQLTKNSRSRNAKLMIGNETALEFGVKALERAASLGHADAQTTLAHAFMSGIWPTTVQPSVEDVQHADKSNVDSLPSPLIVQDTLVQDNMQQTKALLLYRMAAMSGNVEAAMAMAHRLEVMHADGSISSSTIDTTVTSPQQILPKQCLDRLVYYRAAANLIMDRLETDPNSRAKILPPSDKHLLYQIHLHGGSGSKLEHHNQADESAQAIQYYKVRASGADGSPHAAFTLANLHHYGLRGVEQNASLALHYYEKAAKQGHWEAAGQAAQFHFWGIGTSDNNGSSRQDPYAAHRFVQIGMPWDLDGCRKRLERKLKAGASQQAADADLGDLSLCDANAMNVMGLLLVFGLPMIVGQNSDLAQGYFQLAKEQGNRDAPYNAAMLKLGWKTHYQALEELDELGSTSAGDFDSVMTDKNIWKHGLTQAEMQSIVADLTTAAGLGHVQAKHRLGMMYAEGVQLLHKGGIVNPVPRDCDKALKHFRWITEHASPHKSNRLRRAYKQYAAGDAAGSLRNYLVAAETGSDLAQLNAAFILEQGECLGMNRVDCAKASVRLWKAAATRGHAEASLRVGDFYYYGRLRPEGLVGPSSWMHYILYPEKHVSEAWTAIRNWTGGLRSSTDSEARTNESEEVCLAGSQDGTCMAEHLFTKEGQHNTLQKDMEMAVHYYRLAADRSASPRANFNLGYMYQHGYGVKQDFHLAQRHYDLAAAASAHEAELPVSVALVCMRIHEELVKLWMARNELLPQSLTGFLVSRSVR
ncbi:hypothetical protein MPSEU_000621600 [Mayamaea pseudoterrestris]|nr:hypothetical protein MPSEU_000621600 [Mayamaea pseudoterrestris]